jgi:hypothetical protein
MAEAGRQRAWDEARFWRQRMSYQLMPIASTRTCTSPDLAERPHALRI